MRKQGDIVASIPKRPASSPGSRLGAFMGTRIIPRLAPGGFYGRESTRVSKEKDPWLGKPRVR